MKLSLDRSFISSATNDELATQVWIVVFEAKKDTVHWDDALLLPHWRAAYKVRCLESSVLGDGIEDFLRGEGYRYNLMEEDLRLIGALTLIPLYAEASALYARIGEVMQEPKTDVAAFRAVEEAIDTEFDRKYPSEYVCEFIKSHPDLFSE